MKRLTRFFRWVSKGLTKLLDRAIDWVDYHDRMYGEWADNNRITEEDQE